MVSLAAPLVLFLQHPALGAAVLVTALLMVQGPGRASYRAGFNARLRG